MKFQKITVRLALSLIFLCCSQKSLFVKTIEVEIKQTLDIPLQEEDTDNDKKITIDDFSFENTEKGDKQFALKANCNSNGIFLRENPRLIRGR